MQIKYNFGILSHLWRNSSFRNSLKARTFKSNVVSVLLYGSSTWNVTKSISTKLQVLVDRCLRSIFHIYWTNIYIFGTNTRNRARPRTYSKLWSA